LWLRKVSQGIKEANGVLQIAVLSGGIYGTFFGPDQDETHQLATNFYFRAPATNSDPESKQCNCIETDVIFSVITDGSHSGDHSTSSTGVVFEWGQQAGLFWYIDDNNYIKLVLEGSKDGSCAVVLAGEKSGSPVVIAKVSVATSDVFLPGGAGMRLRLEVNEDGSVTGMFQQRGSPCMRLVGRGLGYEELVSPARVQVGIGAHGGSLTTSELSESSGRCALFYNFRGVWTPQDRIQMGKGPGNNGLSRAAGAAAQTTLGAVVGPATDVLSGWTLSPDLSEDERQNIASLLGGAAPAAYLPAPTDAAVDPVVDVLSGWTLSPDLNDDERQNIASLLGGGAPAAYSPSS
jgi:hypothetical protein